MRPVFGSPLLAVLVLVACHSDRGVGPTQLSRTIDAQAVASRTTLPRPQLYLDSRTPTALTSGSGITYYRYELSVRNSDAYPDQLFSPAPQLPPCGLNTNSSRSWVLIYDESGAQVYGFCGFQASANLNSIWFAVAQGAVAPRRVYIAIWDRAANSTYVSNPVPIPPP